MIRMVESSFIDNLTRRVDHPRDHRPRDTSAPVRYGLLMPMSIATQTTTTSTRSPGGFGMRVLHG